MLLDNLQLAFAHVISGVRLRESRRDDESCLLLRTCVSELVHPEVPFALCDVVKLIVDRQRLYDNRDVLDESALQSKERSCM